MNNEDLFLERLTTTHLPHLIPMVMELWQDAVYEEELVSWKLIAGSKQEYCLIAKSKSEYIGFVHITLRSDYVQGVDADKIPYLEAIYVRPAHRKTKIATLLLNHAEAWAKQQGFKHLASDTEMDNLNSQAFHAKVGFKEVGKIICYVKSLS
jgi:aminoglycoside 6'-N-acetyltransferase I